MVCAAGNSGRGGDEARNRQGLIMLRQPVAFFIQHMGRKLCSPMFLERHGNGEAIVAGKRPEYQSLDLICNCPRRRHFTLDVQRNNGLIVGRARGILE